MDIPLAKYITFPANYCGYGGTVEELILNYVHSLFWKTKSATFWSENPNWREATNGLFADNYRKAMKVKIATL